VDGPADEQAAIGQLDGGVNRQTLSCQMNPISLAGEGNIEAVVDGEARPVLAHHGQQLFCLGVKRCR
jgi:hypothetical protein